MLNSTLTRACNDYGNGALFLIGDYVGSLTCVQTATNALADKCLQYVRSHVSFLSDYKDDDIKSTLGEQILTLYSGYRTSCFFKPMEMIVSQATGRPSLVSYSFMVLGFLDFNDPKFKHIKTATVVMNIAMGVFCLSTGGLSVMGALNLAHNISEISFAREMFKRLQNLVFCHYIQNGDTPLVLQADEHTEEFESVEEAPCHSTTLDEVTSFESTPLKIQQMEVVCLI